MIRLGVDLGGRRVGLAVSDALGIAAFPLEALRVRSREEAFGAVREAARRHGAEEVVVGLPLRMNGRRGAEAKEAEDFARRLREAGTPAALWDERLTTAEAERGLRAMDLGRRQRQRHIDAHAAQRLLAAYLDFLRYQPRTQEAGS